MENVLERIDTRPATVVVNSGLERYEKRPVLSKKSREAHDFLDAHPIPAWIFLHKYSKTQQEEGICINGILARGNVEANTFSVAVTVNKYAQSNPHHARNIR
jgi:hypothetical protein